MLSDFGGTDTCPDSLHAEQLGRREMVATARHGELSESHRTMRSCELLFTIMFMTKTNPRFSHRRIMRPFASE